MPVKAPFRFARIWRHVHLPDWGPLASHDVPFADGVSGEATVEITARTPLVVGGARSRATVGAAAEVRPFQLPDNRWAIPDSTLQGMARGILEIATFSRLGDRIDDRRVAFRDMTGRGVAKRIYGRRLTGGVNPNFVPNSQSGWLRKRGKGVEMLPCAHARILISDLEAARATAVGATPVRLLEMGTVVPALGNLNGKEADDRYAYYLGGRPLTGLDGSIAYQPAAPQPLSAGGTAVSSRCKFAGAGVAGTVVDGTVVLCGKPQDGVFADRAKKREFVFHTPNRAGALAAAGYAPIPDDVWRDFRVAHERGMGSEKESSAWTFWKGEFDDGRPIPVFYWQEGGAVAMIGMAFAPRIAHRLSALNLLRNSSPDHVAGGAWQPDMADLVFGAKAEIEGRRGIKRRASFSLATTDDPRPLTEHGPYAAQSPRAGHYGLYVEQDHLMPTGENPGLHDLQTMTPVGAQTPRLSGVKIWPAVARQDGADVVRAADPPPEGGSMMTLTKYRALPAGTRFTSRLRFHNLRPAELGALLWALSYGRAEAFGTDPGLVTLCHRLGAGKPRHLGEVSLRIADLQIDDAPGAEPQSYLDAFTGHMAGQAGFDWAGSQPVRALIRAADPSQNSAEDMKYMPLQGNGPNETLNRQTIGTYLGERYHGRALPDYLLSAAIRVEAAAPPPPPPFVIAVGVRVRMAAGTRWAGQIGMVGEAVPSTPPRWAVRLESGDYIRVTGEALARP